MQDLHKSASREWTFLASCQKTPGTLHIVIEKNNREDAENNTCVFLRTCQPPACQGIPVATTDRSGMTQCQAEKTGDIEQTTREQDNSTKVTKKEIKPSLIPWTTWQRDGHSGQHLEDFATLPSAVVKVVRVWRNRQYAFVVTIEKMLTRGKRAMALTASSRKLRKRGVNGATPASSKHAP